MRIQRAGQDLIVIIPPEDITQQGLREGDEVMMIKTTDRETFEQALTTVLREHATTFEYLKDK